MKVFKLNISGIMGFLFFIGLITLGIVAFTFFLVLIGILVGLSIIALLIYRLLVFLGIKKKRKESVSEYNWEETKEIPASFENEKDE